MLETLTAPSTASPSAQAQPDSGPKVETQGKPQTLAEKSKAALADLRSKGASEVGKLATETDDTLAETTPGITEGELNEDGTQKETPQGESKENPLVLDESLEEISIGGVKVPLAEAFEKMEFEVFADDQFHEVDGRKLLDLASIGLHAAKTNREAKEFVAQADKLVREVEQAKAKDVENILENLLRNAVAGKNAQGQPFNDANAQKRAVELATKMSEGFNGNKGNQAQRSPEDIEKLVQERVQKSLEEFTKKSSQESKVKDIVQGASQALSEITKSDATYFVKADGKLNTTLLETYRESLKNKSQVAWEQAGSPMDVNQIKDIVTKTRAKLLPDLQISAPKTGQPAQKKSPILTPTSGAGLVPGENAGKPPVFKNYAESVAWAKKNLGIGKKK